MAQTFKATYDGISLHPAESVDLEPNTVVRVTIETIDPVAPDDFLAVCLAARLNGHPIGRTIESIFTQRPASSSHDLE